MKPTDSLETERMMDIDYTGVRMKTYKKPTLERFGTLRDLTLIGLGQDGDGGIQGFGRLLQQPPGNRS